MSIVDTIVKYRRKLVEFEKKYLRINNQRTSPLISLRDSITSSNRIGRIGVIAEYKRASPKGIISLELKPEEYVCRVRNYVCGFSVLTEPFWFLGNYTYLVLIKELSNLPILFKDFIIDTWQVDLAYTLGADAILLISELLSNRELENLYEYALNKDLEVVIETNSKEKAIEIANTYDKALLGVNARNLKTLQVSIEKAINIIREVRNSVENLIILESGISSKEHMIYAKEGGANAVLIGTSLMRGMNVLDMII